MLYEIIKWYKELIYKEDLVPYIKGNLKISHTIVPESYEKQFPVWDSYLYKNIIRIKD